MRTILSIVCSLFIYTLRAQVELGLCDSNIVQYSVVRGYEELDSIVFIHNANDPQNRQVRRVFTENGRMVRLAYNDLSYCEKYIVFFDRESKKVAYKSESTGDTCTTFDFWRNGQLKKRTIYCKRANFYPYKYYEEWYCQNGTLIKKALYGGMERRTIVKYYCSGTKKLEYDWEGGKVIGKWTEWYENGKMKLEAFYDNNTPTGEWKYWNEEGILTKTELYKDGKLIRSNNY